MGYSVCAGGYTCVCMCMCMCMCEVTVAWAAGRSRKDGMYVNGWITQRNKISMTGDRLPKMSPPLHPRVAAAHFTGFQRSCHACWRMVAALAGSSLTPAIGPPLEKDMAELLACRTEPACISVPPTLRRATAGLPPANETSLLARQGSLWTTKQSWTGMCGGTCG